MSRIRRWQLVIGSAFLAVIVVVVALWVWPWYPWRDDPAAGGRDVRLQCRDNHDDPYLVRITVTNHTGYQTDYRINGEDDESTTSSSSANRYPFRAEVDGVPGGASRIVYVTGPDPTGYVVGGQCRLLGVQTRHGLF